MLSGLWLTLIKMALKINRSVDRNRILFFVLDTVLLTYTMTRFNKFAYNSMSVLNGRHCAFGIVCPQPFYQYKQARTKKKTQVIKAIVNCIEANLT